MPAVINPPELDVEAVIGSISIPPRPALLTDVQAEMALDDPDVNRIAGVVGKVVAMTATVMRSVISPF